jgi:hypothetical protein
MELPSKSLSNCSRNTVRIKLENIVRNIKEGTMLEMRMKEIKKNKPIRTKCSCQLILKNKRKSMKVMRKTIKK